MNLHLIILLPLLGSLLPPLAVRYGRRVCAWTTGLIAACALLATLPPLILTFRGTPPTFSWTWLSSAGLDIALRMDGLAALFALLILGIGLLIILYARYYLSASDPMGRLYGQLLLFMSAMLGVVLADNLLLLLVFWELTSLSSFLLIGYWHHQPEARQGARMALVVTGSGGLALLAGLLLLGDMAGTHQISLILERGDLIRAHPGYIPTLVLVLLGAFTKSAQFPFHFWLPRAMAAPTPISAYLHSATMVKAGVFLLARFYPALAGTDAWFFLVGGTGLATLLMGAYIALFKHDLKGLLAYSTISHLGLIVLLFGLDTPLAAVAAVFHIVNHATFKASLFMAAGIIDHETGTRDMRQLNGLWRYMPHTATLAMVAAAAMAGVPLLNGFLSKEMFFAETLHAPLLGVTAWLLPLAATMAGIFAVAYSARFIHDVFFNGKPLNLPKFPPHEPPRFMKIPVEILVLLCLLVGMAPEPIVGPILSLAAGSVLGEAPPSYSLAIWHGFNLPLLMSIIALCGGVLVYMNRHRLFAWHDCCHTWPGAAEIYQLGEDLLAGTASRCREFLESTTVRQASTVLLAVAALAMLVPMTGANLTGPAAIQDPDALSVLGAILLIGATLLTTLWHQSRLAAVIALSVVGLMTALVFVRFSAPDLALTQLSVEVVTIMLLLLALFFLPQHDDTSSTGWRKAGRAGLATLLGAGAGLLTWATLTRPQQTISGYFMENSLPGGGGTNVVNVILVDFRGFDTLGEVTVLAIAAIGIFAMLDNLRLPTQTADPDGRPWSSDPHPLILAQTTRFLLPLALMVAVYLFLRGHNLPGGGFIAGLVTAVALILQYMASGISWTQQQWRQSFHPVIAAGVLMATGTGLASILFGYPFLTTTFGHVALPIVGEFELASAMVFDLGVLLTVVGVIMLVLANLGKLTRRSRRITGRTL